MKCNQAGIDLIRSFEGCRLESYLDQNNIPTIGFGHTGSDVYIGLIWTQDQADSQLSQDIAQRAEAPVNAYLTRTLSDNQFSAFCSLCFNIGSGRFKGSSALHLANIGNLTDVPAHILLWDEAGGGVDAGLVRRRNAECTLWNTED